MFPFPKVIIGLRVTYSRPTSFIIDKYYLFHSYIVSLSINESHYILKIIAHYMIFKIVQKLE